MIVLDASATLSWLFPDELTDVSAHLLARARDGVVVPAHWAYEIANGALMGEIRERVGAELIGRWYNVLHDLAIDVVPADASDGARLLPLARSQGLTIYDAAYLDLAQRRSLALAAFDKALIRAARATGVPLAAEQP